MRNNQSFNLPIGYTLSLSDLEGQLLLDSQDLENITETLPDCQDITGAVVSAEDGEYQEVWITNSGRPFDNDCIYEKVL